MISADVNRNFFAGHYEWLALGAAALALAGAAVYALGSFDEDPDAAAEDAVSQYRVSRAKDGTGVKKADLSEYDRASSLLDSKKVPRLAEVSAKSASFLASAAHVFCENAECRRPMPFGAEMCPFCKHKPAEKELPVVIADTDGDGMTDDWEKKYGLDPANGADAGKDKDGDGFTNLEEFTAKTDPTDGNDHPDYLDSLAVTLPLAETKLPFVFEKVMKLPAGYRFYFKDPVAKNDYGRRGLQYTPLAGEDIGKTGYTVVSYNEKSEKREIKAAKGEKALFKTVDVSTATIERKSDKRRFDLVVGDRRHIAIDIQATLRYDRNGVKEFKVITGDTVDLNGSKYTIKAIESVGKGARVTLADTILKKEKVIEALEQ